MKLTIEPTGDFLTIEGARCRLWTGRDQGGTPCHVYVRTVSPQTHDPEALAAFNAALTELPPLTPCAMFVDYRFFTDSVEDLP